MPRYMAFIDKPVDRTAFDVELDPDASFAENNQRVMEAIGLEDAELFFTMSKFYAVALFNASDNHAAEQIVREVRNATDVQAEVVPVFEASELEE